jgi:hypothetical protein
VKQSPQWVLNSNSLVFRTVLLLVLVLLRLGDIVLLVPRGGSFVVLVLHDDYRRAPIQMTSASPLVSRLLADVRQRELHRSGQLGTLHYPRHNQRLVVRLQLKLR